MRLRPSGGRPFSFPRLWRVRFALQRRRPFRWRWQNIRSRELRFALLTLWSLGVSSKSGQMNPYVGPSHYSESGIGSAKAGRAHLCTIRAIWTRGRRSLTALIRLAAVLHCGSASGIGFAFTIFASTIFYWAPNAADPCGVIRTIVYVDGTESIQRSGPTP